MVLQQRFACTFRVLGQFVHTLQGDPPEMPKQPTHRARLSRPRVLTSSSYRPEGRPSLSHHTESFWVIDGVFGRPG